jgi:transposase-like protein
MNITFRNDRWVVAMSWSEAQEAYEDGSPTERAISAVADRHDVAREQLRSSTIRTSEDGMSVVVEANG